MKEEDRRELQKAADEAAERAKRNEERSRSDRQDAGKLVAGRHRKEEKK